MKSPEERLADALWGEGSPDYDTLLWELKEALKDAELALIEVHAPSVSGRPEPAHTKELAAVAQGVGPAARKARAKLRDMEEKAWR